MVVLLFAVVGPVDTLQQTPLAVMAEPPSLEIVPPLAPDVEVTAETSVVAPKVGAMANVVNVIGSPYEVVTLFVA